MTTFVDTQRRRASREEAQSMPAGALVVEIVQALIRCGGQAHRDVVVARIAVARHERGEDAPDDLQEHVVKAFNVHCLADDGSEGVALFRLPFGPGSRRWALTDQAPAFIGAGRLN